MSKAMIPTFPRWPNKRKIAIRLAACLALAPITSACKADSAFKCGNTDVKDSIEANALPLFQSNPKKPDEVGVQKLRVYDVFETSAQSDTKTCSAKLSEDPRNDGPEFAISYDVVRTDEGHILFSFDTSGLSQQILLSAIIAEQKKAREAGIPDIYSPKPPPNSTPPSDPGNASASDAAKALADNSNGEQRCMFELVRPTTASGTYEIKPFGPFRVKAKFINRLTNQLVLDDGLRSYPETDVKSLSPCTFVEINAGSWEAK